MKVTRQLNIKEKGGQFFTDMININNFDSNLLHIDRTALDHYFIIHYVKYLKNSNKFDNLYLVFNDLDAMFEESDQNKYLIFSSTEKNRIMLENYLNIFDNIAEQIELMIDDNIQHNKDLLKIKFKANDGLPFNEEINIPICGINVSSIFKQDDEYYSQVFGMIVIMNVIFLQMICRVKSF